MHGVSTHVVLQNGFALRSHVNGIIGSCADRQNTPQVPRIYMNVFPHRPTAHVQTLKRIPRPFASPEVNEKYTVFEIKSLCRFNTFSRGTYLQSGHVRHPGDVTPLSLIHEEKERRLPFG